MIEAGTGTDWRAYLYLVKQSGSAWVNDRAPTMGAALAFYSAFALAPLLIVLIAVAGAIFGPDAARGAIAGQLTGLVGAGRCAGDPGPAAGGAGDNNRRASNHCRIGDHASRCNDRPGRTAR